MSENLSEVNPTSQQLYNCAIGFIVVDTIIFLLFVTSTSMIRKDSGWDIYFLLPLSYLAVMGNAFVGLLLVKIGGVGRHWAYNLATDPLIISRYLQLQTGVEIIYMASITFPKMAILTLYLKIFIGRVTRGLTWMMGVILAMFFFSGLILALALCRPYAFKWDKTIHGTCGDIMAGYRWISIPSLITDFFILIIPIPTIWKLQMNKYKKFGLFVTFLTGSLGFITAIVRCSTFYKSDLFSDPTWYAGETMAWTIVEPSAYFICACLPRLRPLIERVLEVTGLGRALKKAITDIKNNTKGTHGASTGNAKSGGASSTGFPSKSSDDLVGFVQLEDLRLERSLEP